MSLIVGADKGSAWKAGWAWSRERGGFGLERRFFRRTFSLEAVPESFVAFVTADSRYKLFVNGRLIGRGPLKGTLGHYHYEGYELAPHLVAGANVIAVEVVHFGKDTPLSEEHSGYAGLLFQADDLSTPEGWKVFVDRGYAPDRTPYTCNAHFFINHLERVQVAALPLGWTQVGFDDSAWEDAVPGAGLNVQGGDGDKDAVWNWRPREIAALAEEPRFFARTIVGMQPADHIFGDVPKGWRLAAGEAGEIVLDAGAHATGYPVLHVRGGQGRKVEVVYSEAVWRLDDAEADVDDIRYDHGVHKGQRDQLAGGVIHGYRDTVELDGREFAYEPFHWRTFRYVRIKVSAGDTPFELVDARYRWTSYPSPLRATFECEDDEVMRIWEMCWRTQQNCSHETFEDCPYYEQLNYMLDTRNEALIAYAMTGDASLARHCLRLFRDSLRPDGMVSSRIPTTKPQTIPNFGLWWIQALDDYYQWTGDAHFVRSCLVAVDGVLAWVRERIDDDGLLGPLGYWTVIGGDGTGEAGIGVAIEAGHSTYVAAQYATAIQAAQRLHRECGHPEDGERWQPTLRLMRDHVESAWSDERGLFLEQPGREDPVISEHTQVQAIQAGFASASQVRRIAQSLETDPNIVVMTKQMGYERCRGIELCGRYDRVIALAFEEYREMLRRGFTTTAEGAKNRSDCHAWSAWPPVELLTGVLGIRPGEPGFGSVHIRPQPVFARASGSMPTPHGEVRVSYEQVGQELRVVGEVPDGVSTTVELPSGKRYSLPEGGPFEFTG